MAKKVATHAAGSTLFGKQNMIDRDLRSSEYLLRSPLSSRFVDFMPALDTLRHATWISPLESWRTHPGTAFGLPNEESRRPSRFEQLARPKRRLSNQPSHQRRFAQRIALQAGAD
jgi:hypothetical protein